MPSISNVVCADCRVEMRAHKTGDVVEELQSDGEPYKVWSCDRFKCPRCESEVLVNFGRQPIAEHWQPGYGNTQRRASLSFGGRNG
jgi:hypothetical protein